jgi:hypothetical protein
MTFQASMAVVRVCMQWQLPMPEEKTKPRYPEVTFLPPLNMVLSFFKKKDKPSIVNNAVPEQEVHEQDVKRIIDHITHNEQQQIDQKTND